MEKKLVYIYLAYERFWHWSQAILITLLAFTGFEIHGSFRFLGFETAVNIHNGASVALLILIVFTIFWHFTTGEWKQYIPTSKKLIEQANYYLKGIFKNEPHPTKKTVRKKLNPLQRLVYLVLKVILFPLVVISGMLYMFYRFPSDGEIRSLKMDGLENVALLHTIGAFLIVVFLIVHLYLITTGETVTSNLKAMITGYEELEEDGYDEIENKEEENIQKEAIRSSK